MSSGAERGSLSWRGQIPNECLVGLKDITFFLFHEIMINKLCIYIWEILQVSRGHLPLQLPQCGSALGCRGKRKYFWKLTRWPFDGAEVKKNSCSQHNGLRKNDLFGWSVYFIFKTRCNKMDFSNTLSSEGASPKLLKTSTQLWLLIKQS